MAIKISIYVDSGDSIWVAFTLSTVREQVEALRDAARELNFDVREVKWSSPHSLYGAFPRLEITGSKYRFKDFTDLVAGLGHQLVWVEW